MSHPGLLAPSARARRGGPPPVQPNLFTSSHFIDPLRTDIDALLKAYVERCKLALTNSEDARPFAWFKEIWLRQKWDLIHLKCTEPRARQTFLEVTFRLFLERTREKEPVLNRLTALFALYTFFTTQPSTLHALPYIPIPIDVHEELLSLPSVLPPTFDHYSTYTILRIHSLNAFNFLPSSSLHPSSPTVLPDSTVAIVPEPALSTEIGGKVRAKTGRPSAGDLQRRAVRAVSALDSWSSLNSPSRPPPALTMEKEVYEASKRHLTQTISHQHIRRAEEVTMGKLKELEDIFVRQGGDEGVSASARLGLEDGGLLRLSRSFGEGEGA